MTEAHQNSDAQRGGRIALLLLLPSLVLAWPGPGAVLRDVFDATELTATAVAVLATLPMAIFAVARSHAARPRFFMLWLPALALAALAQRVPGWSLTDTLEASRGQWTLYLAAIATWAGAAVEPTARRAFLRGSMLASLAFTSFALWQALVSTESSELGGVLGNTGELASAALFGAVLGARAVLREDGPWRIVGGATVLAFATQAVLAPSIANLLSFAVGILAWAVLAPGALRERALRLALGLAPVACLWALQSQSAQHNGSAHTSRAEGESVLGGVAVRASIGAASLELIGEAPLFGVGPGQFVVEFPPHRRLEEIEASSDRSDTRIYTEVEHPHQDALLVLAEYGLFAGGALLAFWILAGLRAIAFVQRGETPEVGLATAMLSVLAGTFANAALGMNPAALIPAFVAMGMLLSTKSGTKSRPPLRFAVPSALALLLFLSVPRAWNAVEHGRALAELAGASRDVPLASELSDSLSDALAACPDSVVAQSLAARLDAQQDGGREQSLAHWRAVLALRPHRIEALLETARQLAEQENFEAAEKLAKHVLELDPAHPIALRNLTRFRFYAGTLATAQQSLNELEAHGLLDEEFGLALVSRLLLGGQVREGQFLLARLSPSWAELDGDGAWVEAGARRSAGETRLADAFQSYAHLLWARDLAASGNYNRAVAAYRQNLRITRDYVPPEGPARVRMEFCAALWLDDRRETAAHTAETLHPQPNDWAGLPSWAGEALRESELFP